MVTLKRALRCRLRAPLSPPALSLLADFRLLVNIALREVLRSGRTSRHGLLPFTQQLARDHLLLFGHTRLAVDTALSLAKGHRTRLRRHLPSSVPYVRRPFLIADAENFHLDPTTGHLRLSMRFGEWVGLDLVLSDHHRARLARATLQQLRLGPDSAVLILAEEAPEPYVPTTLFALDTNERSLDGVYLRQGRLAPVTVPFPEVALVQHRHFVRRRRLGRKKAHDRRVGRRLGGREGRRERNRVTQRLHVISKGLIAEAVRRRAVLALEDLHLPPTIARGRRRRRRLSSWPRAELHRQLRYKAEARGVPIVWVDPAYTSRSCPVCGAISERRRRVGTVFVCRTCSWRCDRQVNAGLNIGRTALVELSQGASKPGLGGLVLDPDALADDGMTLLYPRVAPGGTGGPDGQGGSESRARQRPRF